MKELTNAFYGVLGSPHYRLHNDDIQGAITYSARMLIEYVKNFLIARDYKVLYGDTDSIFFEKKTNETVQDLQTLCTQVNDSLDHFTQTFGVPHNDGIIQLEFEAILDKWFQPGVKKKYYGRYAWKDAHAVDVCTNDMKIRGFEARRSNTSFYTKIKQKELMIISFNGTQAVNQWVMIEEKRWNTHAIDIQSIALNTAVKRDLDYKTNTQVLKAIHNSQQQSLQLDVKLGKVKIYFVKGIGEIAIGFDDDLPTQYIKKLDWEEHKRRCFDLPMGKIIQFFKVKPMDSWIVTQ